MKWTSRKLTKRRIGPAMRAAEAYVRAFPGATPLEVATSVGPHGSRQYGYRAVWRAVAAGLIRADRREDKRGCYRLFPIAWPDTLTTQRCAEGGAQ